MKTIKIIIDKDIMEKYEVDYFKLNPRCRVFPKYFKNPIPMSLNTFLNLKREAQGTVKSKYKDFAVWLAKQYGISERNFEDIKVTYDFYFGIIRKRDVDNYVMANKLLMDGFVSADVLIDDNSKHLALQFNPFKLDRKNPRVELTFDIIK